MVEKAEGILLKRINFRETSLLVTFFTKEFGKIKGIIKGVRKDPKKIASNLSLCSYNDIQFYKKRNSELNLISQSDLIKDYSLIRKDMKKISLASYILEFADTVLPLHDKNQEVFKLLLDCFESLQITDPERILYPFQIKMLSLSGFKPHLDACIVCKKELHDTANFSVYLGGLICPNCKNIDRNSSSVLKGSVNSLIFLEISPWQKALNLSLSKQIKSELRSILYNFLSFHLDKNMKSYRFLTNPI
ncbi:MAG: DNA repair protein RecO [Candidatus Omnitrophica bacterium]|nr:DNA repair protein RecO [Candidatus Omnitrophota bacterium]